jgi:hypothetical protein
MPPALWDDASKSATKDKSREMDAATRQRRQDPALCPTDDDAIAPRQRRQDPALCPTDDDAIGPKQHAPNKQSLDYVWRTGLAGGLAGCAVCIAIFSIMENY